MELTGSNGSVTLTPGSGSPLSSKTSRARWWPKHRRTSRRARLPRRQQLTDWRSLGVVVGGRRDTGLRSNAVLDLVGPVFPVNLPVAQAGFSSQRLGFLKENRSCESSFSWLERSWFSSRGQWFSPNNHRLAQGRQGRDRSQLGARFKCTRPSQQTAQSLEVAPATGSTKFQLSAKRSYRFIVTVRFSARESALFHPRANRIHPQWQARDSSRQDSHYSGRARLRRYDVFPSKAGLGDCAIRTLSTWWEILLWTSMQRSQSDKRTVRN